MATALSSSAASASGVRMEQWAALAPLTSQERDSVSRLASALSEAAAASFAYSPQPPLAADIEEDDDGSETGATVVGSDAPGRASSAANGASGAGHQPILAGAPGGPTAESLQSPPLPQMLSPGGGGGALAAAAATGPGAHGAHPTTATQQGMSLLQASQSAAIASLAQLSRTLEEDVLNEHVLKAIVNLAELRAGVRSVGEDEEENGR